MLGQLDFAAVGENRWELVAPDTFCWPYGLSLHGGRLAVADSAALRKRLQSLEFPRLRRLVVHPGADFQPATSPAAWRFVQERGISLVIAATPLL